MRVFALVNQKGGCGKTTAAINWAGALAARGRRVLLVDLDPQAHATMGLGVAADHAPSLIDVLREEATADEALVCCKGGVWLLPANAALGEFEEQSERAIGPEGALARQLDAMRSAFDEVVLDCPPRVDGVLAANALRAAQTAVLVVETGAFALQGAVQALRVLDEMRADRGEEFDLAVLGTLFDRRTNFARELLVALHARFADEMFETVIRTSVRLREAAACGVPVQVLDPSCRAAEDFDALAGEWLARAGVETPVSA
ncbi:MAG: ParA family protein [Planctomycetes bacterium]|nr:ParA family protein [Planctomycetota bacterium]MCB9904590.1 ParA family protein [Planctomycetota bacterium]